MATYRAKYYIGWKLGQTGVDLCGLSYSPQKKKINDQDEIEHRFDKIDSCGITEVEMNMNPKIKMTVKIF